MRKVQQDRARHGAGLDAHYAPAAPEHAPYLMLAGAVLGPYPRRPAGHSCRRSAARPSSVSEYATPLMLSERQPDRIRPRFLSAVSTGMICCAAPNVR